MLTITDLTAGYGTKRAVHDLSLSVAPGEVVAVLGHNGAGKTTTLRAISGAHHSTGGRLLDGEPLARTAAGCVRSGVRYVPEDKFVFADLTVEDNLTLSGFVLSRSDTLRIREEVCERFPELGQRSQQLAGTLSGGERRVLSIGMALMSRPRFLLLDEPSLGLSPVKVHEVAALVEELATVDGLGILLVEQNVRMACHVASTVHVIRAGRVVHSEPGDQARQRADWWDLF